MIARRWHGAVPAAKMQEYLSLMRNVALPDYLATPGNRGAWCLTRTEGNLTHFEMLTFWQDIEAIKRFAGDDHSKAKYYDFDSNFLLEKEPYVRHFDVHAGTQPARLRIRK
jgi:hypothetical protein